MRRIGGRAAGAALAIMLATAPGFGAETSDCDIDAVAGVLSKAMRVSMQSTADTLTTEEMRARVDELKTDPEARRDFLFGFKRSYPECSEDEARQALDIATGSMDDYLAETE
ncbi:hypothetical protein [Amorphus orientalis]|uniref:UDP-N-acetyl-D-mannosaminuronate dehydrogenase n=1 Tax=Amorphus orientalis TaxID=649198 RepID=A0AAE3VSU7_9HYPH|nr:hypothetical protein [Amorphus orientalis]MDQ0317555.1 UDP-N-acetyl-D-mannosaminuronate dehydrogenase [Amorphus orientalis]